MLQGARWVDTMIVRQVVAGPTYPIGLAFVLAYLIGTVVLVLTHKPWVPVYLLIGFGALVLVIDGWAYAALLVGIMLSRTCGLQLFGREVALVAVAVAVVGIMLSVAVKKFRDVTRLENEVHAQRDELQALMIEKLAAERVREEYLRRLSLQLELARHVQERLMALTEREIVLDGLQLDVTAINQASMQVGGDFYRLLTLSPTSVALVVGDVMGRGVAAALVMTMTIALFEEAARGTSDAGGILRHVNARLCEDLGPSVQVFVTAAIIVVDVVAHRYHIANAGHEMPLLKRAGRVHAIGPQPDVPLGVIGDYFYETSKLPLRCEDSVVMYTDGLVHDEDLGKPAVGRRGLRHVLRDLPRADAETLVRALCISDAVEDDITVLTAHVTAVEDAGLRHTPALKSGAHPKQP